MKKIISMFMPILLLLAFITLVGHLINTIKITPLVLIVIAVIIAAIVIMVWRKGGKKPVSQEELDQIDAFSKDAFADDPKSRSQFQAAARDYASSLPRAAIKKLSKLVPLCKTDADTYSVSLLLAMCHMAVQIYGEAVQAYNKAILIRPSSELAARIGFCYHRLGELENAKNNYEFATELDSRNVDAWANLATVCVAIGDYDEALWNAETALELDSGCSSAMATSAICYGILEDEENYQRYFKLATENGYTAEKIEYTISVLKKDNHKEGTLPAQP